MKKINEAIAALAEVRELAEALEKRGECIGVSGLAPVHRAMLAAALAEEERRPFAVLCADDAEALRFAADFKTLTGQESAVLLGRQWQLRDKVAASHEYEQLRIAALARMARQEVQTVVATVDALLARTISPAALAEALTEVELGMTLDPTVLAARLVRAGYVRCDQVEGAGQFALRGGIVDVYTPLGAPVRIEFFGDEVDAMGEFDAQTQRRTKNIKKFTILPAAEVLPFAAEGGAAAMAARMEHAAKKLAGKENFAAAEKTLRSDIERLKNDLPLGGIDRYLAAAYPTAVTAADYLAADALVLVCEGARVMERAKLYAAEEAEDTRVLLEEGVLCGAFAERSVTLEQLTAKLSGRSTVQMDALPTSRYLTPPRRLMAMNVRSLPSYGGSLETAAADIEHFLSSDWAVTVLCSNETRGRNLLRLLEERGIRARPDFKNETLPAAGEVSISLGALSAGCEWPQCRLALLTEGQFTAAAVGKGRREKLKADSSRQKLRSYTDLNPGDLVVHVHHGIGRFVGMERMKVDGVVKDYIKIAYAGADSLYVPATQLDMVAKYIGSGGMDENGERTARLSRLGGTDWTKAKSRAKAAAKDLAKGLIALYAERQRRPGFAFSPDSPWQREFEDAFDFVETDDQLRAAADIKRDMEKTVPMDRLLCGDVGYGKTEVALRAVMKCVLDGKQAAILVPTTVLAQQHYATAMSRFRSFPVTIEVLSRFKTPAQKKKVLEETAAGRVDLLIGTHSLLQKSLKFKDLGLLIIDEEQRFGVAHKEKLKEMARQVDTLTLTATPIPRTLNMALSGIRDMSTIEVPPSDRQVVQTYVLEHDWGVLAEAIRREIGRGGQVYYLHNRVETIERCAARLREMFGGEISVAAAHGKLDEKALGAVMQRFSDGEIQVLVCTTIIETGIDIPNVNTLIIEDADRLGLAQLHQIRGRIGRSSRRAYAYMTFRAGKILTEVAAKRLAAIREYAEFGAGFRIAMRDLEIRGAGNLLGPEQSGYMMSVGYDMYLQLLEEAVLEERGEKKSKRLECSADLTVSANIPDSYVSSAPQRMDLYRRIAALRSEEEAQELLDEIIDRFGEPPAPVITLLDVALLRTAASAVGVGDITQRGDSLVFSFRGAFPVEAVMRLCTMAKNRRRLTLAAGAEPRLTLRLASGEDPLRSALALVEELGVGDG